MMTTEIVLIKTAISSGDRVIKTPDETLKVFVSGQVQILFLCAGQSPEKRDVLFICREVLKDLKTKYKALTLKEIEYCFANGVRGEYGENYGINVASISKWLKAYYNSQERAEANKAKTFAGLPERTETEWTPDEILANKREAYNTAFELAKAGKQVKHYGDYVYDYLDEIGEIQFTKEEKIFFYEIAKKELEAEQKEKARNARTPRPIGQYIEQITEKGKIQRAKRIALNEHFRRLLKILNEQE
ncbi:MAG: hypothetical protein LBT50_01140 [Prevotellaceae bacterium]|jgi:hypothetical protein|nr:hypothetical protein [Prevotellaceae bacterium]